jgi:hypothetical protein
MIPGYECTRCHYKWAGRPNVTGGQRPATCPKCGSPYWDRERKHPPSDGKKPRKK